MKKVTGLLMLFLMMVLVGCSEPAAKEYQLETMSETAIKEVVFEDTLSKVDSELLSILYGLEANDIEESILYKGSGATAEEIVLLKLKSEDAAKTALSVLEQYLVSQKEAFSSYVPEEVHRLEKAYLKQNGLYVFLCVATEVEPFKSLVE